VAAVAALAFAVVNLKDYFWYRQGVSLTIADERKPGLYRKMRNVLAASDSLWGLLSATAVLGAGASLVEFSCTAGFPLLWTNLLAAQGVETWTFAGLLGLYLLIYQIDELAIFLAVVFTMKAIRLEERHGRLLKLIGGALMLALAIAMLVNPAAMSTLAGTGIVLGAALAGVLVALAIDRFSGATEVKPHG
jgi:cytochrome c biogenesis protein CcdA